jgi:hypothetical protein
VEAVVGSVDGDERLAELVEGGFGAGPSSSIRLSPLMPIGLGRMPYSGSSAISTSAIRALVVASQPGKSMPAALRIALLPPSQATRYCARSERPSASSTSTPAPSCAKPVTSWP